MHFNNSRPARKWASKAAALLPWLESEPLIPVLNSPAQQPCPTTLLSSRGSGLGNPQSGLLFTVI